MRPTDEQVVARHLRGDPEAFAELVSRYAARLFSLACRSTGERSEAEDIVQECFLRVYAALLRSRADPRPFKPWLFQIAVNLCRDVIGVLIVICLAVIVASALLLDRMAPWLHSLRGIRPPGPVHLGVLPFTRLGPLGPHLAGWRGVATAAASYVFLYFAGLAALFAFPRPVRIVRDAFRRGPREWLRLFGIGALSGAGLVLLVALGLLSSAAFPVPFLLAATALLVVWEGVLGLALALGRQIARWAGLARTSPLVDLALGGLVMQTVWRIPLAGWVIGVLVGALALGGALATRLGAGGGWSLAEFEPAAEESTQ